MSGREKQQKKVFVKTYGCQMNVYDSLRMEDALAKEGYEPVGTMENADLVLLNTCHIREKASEKVYSEIGRIRKIKEERDRQGRPMKLGVTGCVAQAEGGEILSRAPSVDLVVGPQAYHRLPSMLEQVGDGHRVVDTEFDIDEKFATLPTADHKMTGNRGVAAFLTIQEGCDKFCTFCVVPYTRGAEISRSVKQISDEAVSLAAAGVKEITLLGQNVNAWHGVGEDGREWRLGELLHHLAEIRGIKRLRYTTSHPVDMDDGLIAAHAELECLMPYLHLPVQAGSDRILKEMNRHHSVEEYLRIIRRIRESRPDIAISGDFIVGFPGETDEEFEETLKLVEEVNYASAFSFKYSMRPGTPGAEMEDQVPEAVKDARLQRLQSLLNDQQHAFNLSCVGRKVQILLEKPGRREGQLIGWSPWLQSVIVSDSLGKAGDMVHVEITGAGPNSLTAVGI